MNDDVKYDSDTQVIEFNQLPRPLKEKIPQIGQHLIREFIVVKKYNSGAIEVAPCNDISDRSDPEYIKNIVGQHMIGQYVVVRTFSAGVHAGTLKERYKQEVVLKNARRIWYWEGAATLSQLAIEGPKKPENCMFPCEVDEVLLLETIEVLPVTEQARKIIADVPVWEE